MGLGTQLMTSITVGPRMFKCMLTGESRLFRARTRAGYGLENVWGHEAANGILLDSIHDELWSNNEQYML